MNLGSGVKEDVSRRMKHYASDFIDGFHQKTISSSFFLFFACLAPAVTFGGVLGIYTNGAIGAVEMIVASAICGFIFALVSGQPLIILGGTGPMLVITTMLYSLSNKMGLEFLPVYFWVGIWTAVLTIICGLTNLSNIMKYFTRFTDEIFAALISIIFIYEAINSIYKTFQNQDLENHSTALLTLILSLGTYVVASNLSALRQGRFLTRFMREFLADFGPIIAIACMTYVGFVLHEVYLDVLPAPDQVSTTSGRSWIIDPLGIPLWARVGAIVPAIFVTILVFLDQNITARLVNNKDHKLSKGQAYHLDLVVVGGLIGLCSVFGLPWLVAATVRSLNHVRSLASFEDVPSGEEGMENKIVSIRETRLTGILIHLLLGGVLLVLPLVKQVPMAVLYGLFLYMGIVSMKGNQFFERLSLWGMDPKLYPKKHFSRSVPLNRIHFFTFIQFMALVSLWAVKVSPAGILFPVFIALLVPLRKLIQRVFTESELQFLDSEEEPEEEENHWV